MTSLTTLKPKIHILNIVIKLGIAYAYYGFPFFNPNIHNLKKVLSDLTKETWNIPKSTTNILTHLSMGDFGINITSLLPNYMHCKGK